MWMGSSVGSGAGKFKQLRHFTAVTLLMLGLAACAAAPSRPASKTASTPQPLARLVVATPDVDHDVLAHFRKYPRYQTRINAILRAVMEHEKKAG